MKHTSVQTNDWKRLLLLRQQKGEIQKRVLNKSLQIKQTKLWLLAQRKQISDRRKQLIVVLQSLIIRFRELHKAKIKLRVVCLPKLMTIQVRLQNIETFLVRIVKKRVFYLMRIFGIRLSSIGTIEWQRNGFELIANTTDTNNQSTKRTWYILPPMDLGGYHHQNETEGWIRMGQFCLALYRLFGLPQPFAFCFVETTSTANHLAIIEQPSGTKVLLTNQLDFSLLESIRWMIYKYLTNCLIHWLSPQLNIPLHELLKKSKHRQKAKHRHPLFYVFDVWNFIQ